MAETKQGLNQKDGTAWLRLWWPIIVFTLTMMVTLGAFTAQFSELREEAIKSRLLREEFITMRSDVATLQKSLSKVEILLDTHERTFGTLSVQLAEMQKDLDYVRLAIGRLESELAAP